MMSTRLLIALGVALAWACGPDASPKPPAGSDASPPALDRRATGDPTRITVDEEMLRDLRITFGAVESRSDGERLSLLGELAVDQRAYAEVGVPLPARVTRLAVHAGAEVHAGQTLAELSSPELGRARAEYLSADARVRLTDAALERTRALVDERILPMREQQDAEAAVASAQADRRAARATLGAFGVPAPTEEQDAASSTFVLRAPMSGAVIEQSAVLGQMLDPTTPAFRIGNLSRLWLTVHAFERDAVRVREGASARLTFPALPGQEFQGTIAMVGRRVEHESRTVPVRIDVSNADHVLRPGMTATAVVPVGTSEVPILSVPVAAVQRVGTAWCVFVPQDARTFEIRRIGRGRDLSGEIEILSGLRAGESIVVDGAFLLKSQVESRSSSEHGEH